MPAQSGSVSGVKKIFILFIILIIGAGGYYFLSGPNDNFEDLSVAEMHDRIIKERDVAIAKAVENGDYRCCIEPVCTMCFMEANQWNNYTPGTCACDDLIAEGKEACPQCERGDKNLHSNNGIFCDIDAEVPTCGSDK